jgi:hypothetical protein
MTRAHRIVLLWGFLLLARPALAGDDGFGVLMGTMWSQDTQERLKGAEVILRAPWLYKGERTVFTDENGFYWLPQLPPGTYALVFIFKGYRSYLRDYVVRLNQTHVLNVGLVSEDHMRDCLDHFPPGEAP